MRLSVSLLLLCAPQLLGCAAYSYLIPPAASGELSAPADPVFVEPLLENAELELRSASNTSGNVTTTTYWKDKPFFAQPHVRRQAHGALLERLRARKMAGTDALVGFPDDRGARVIRTTLVEHRMVDNNYFMQYMACTMGLAMVFVCPPAPLALIYNAVVPLRQEERIRVVVQVFDLPAGEVQKRLVTTPDSVQPFVNTDGLRPLEQREWETTAIGEQGIFAATWEGWFMSQDEREKRLIDPYAGYLEQALTTTVTELGLGGAGGLGIRGSAPVGDEAAADESASPPAEDVHAY